jgi:hypothetical protein
MPEATLAEAASGLVPASEGWFVANVADAAWVTNEAFGARSSFEANGPALRQSPRLEEHHFRQIGLTLQVLEPGTEHGFVGTDARCVLLMAGARAEGRTIRYPNSALARRHGAAAESETDAPREAYAPYPHWLPGRPAEEGLPWA